MVMLRMAEHAYRETGEKNLCLAGGVALNCVGNGRILRETPFENIWIQPAAGDAGGALGAALAVWHQYLGNERPVSADKRDTMQGTYLGPEFSPEQIRTKLDAAGAVYEELDEQELIDKAARDIANGKVVGWFQGRMEFGPRALGHRSILGDPHSPEMQKQMNLKIKYRESFRPFAPAVVRESVAEYFEMDTDSPYMLLVAPVSESVRVSNNGNSPATTGLEKLHIQRSTIPAITHVDLSARVQTVNKLDNPRFHALISKLGAINGDPVVINTSFNVRGEPIVCTPEDAFRCFMRTEMDVLVLGDFLLHKAEQRPLAAADDNWREEFPAD
jgi:carbamoyltransferase